MAYFVGCSGWQYKHWNERFYPESIPKKDWFSYYAQNFNTVEINATFYRLHKKSTFDKWGSRAPKGFIYAVKGSQYITHRKLLNDPKEALEKFFERATGMGDRLGIVLWQLPPRFKKNVERLAQFCDLLPKGYRHAIEFRHDSWWSEDVYEVLRSHGVAFVSVSAPGGLPDDLIVTADFVYVRFHGEHNWYADEYSSKALQRWARRINDLAVSDAFIYFNNDQSAYAPDNAMELARLLAPSGHMVDLSGYGKAESAASE